MGQHDLSYQSYFAVGPTSHVVLTWIWRDNSRMAISTVDAKQRVGRNPGAMILLATPDKLRTGHRPNETEGEALDHHLKLRPGGKTEPLSHPRQE